MPKRLIASLAIPAALLFLISVALGSSGTTDGDTSTAQQIANVTFPLSVLLGVAVIVILVVSAIRLARRGSDR